MPNLSSDTTNTFTTLQNSVETHWHNFVKQVPGIITAILIIAVGIFLAQKIKQFTTNTLKRKTEDPLMSKFIGNVIKLLLIILFTVFALRIAGLGGIADGLFAAAGASALIIGFAFKDIGENFLAGIILSLNGSFKINDTVQIGDIMGKIKALEFRYTKVKTFDGRDVYIPNSDVLGKPVINFTEDGYFRWDFVVGIAYEDDIDAAEALILETLAKVAEVVEDEQHENYLTVDELSVSTVNIKVFFWVHTMEFRKEAVKTRGDVIKKVKIALEKNGFGMPADITEIKLYGSQQEIPVSVRLNTSQEKGQNIVGGE